MKKAMWEVIWGRAGILFYTFQVPSVVYGV